MDIKTSKRISVVKPYYFATKLAEIADRNAKGESIINLGIGSPDLLPPAAVIEQLQTSISSPTANKYQSYRGIPELRQAVADHYSRQFNVEISPSDEVLPLIGSKEGIMHISMAYLDEGDEVLIPDPGYPTYSSATRLAGGETRPYHLTAETDWMPDIEALESSDLSRVKIMWINSPHMPTGAVMDADMMQRLVDFARKHHILLCHDNPYCYIQNPRPASIFQCEGAKDVCIELFSMSKAYNMAGWRVGAMIGAPQFISAAMTFRSNMDSGMYRPVQEAAAVALREGEEWFAQINAVYAERKQYAYSILDHLGCQYSTDQAGMFVWARVPDEVSGVERWVDDIIDQAQVFLTPGFIFGKNGERYIRISLCSDVDTLKVSLTRIKNAIKIK